MSLKSCEKAETNIYALEISQEERERNFKEGLRQLAQTLIARAETR